MEYYSNRTNALLSPKIRHSVFYLEGDTVKEAMLDHNHNIVTPDTNTQRQLMLCRAPQVPSIANKEILSSTKSHTEESINQFTLKPRARYPSSNTKADPCPLSLLDQIPELPEHPWDDLDSIMDDNFESDITATSVVVSTDQETTAATMNNNNVIDLTGEDDEPPSEHDCLMYSSPCKPAPADLVPEIVTPDTNTQMRSQMFHGAPQAPSISQGCQVDSIASRQKKSDGIAILKPRASSIPAKEEFSPLCLLDQIPELPEHPWDELSSIMDDELDSHNAVPSIEVAIGEITKDTTHQNKRKRADNESATVYGNNLVSSQSLCKPATKPEQENRDPTQSDEAKRARGLKKFEQLVHDYGIHLPYNIIPLPRPQECQPLKKKQKKQKSKAVQLPKTFNNDEDLSGFLYDQLLSEQANGVMSSEAYAAVMCATSNIPKTAGTMENNHFDTSSGQSSTIRPNYGNDDAYFERVCHSIVLEDAEKEKARKNPYNFPPAGERLYCKRIRDLTLKELQHEALR